MITDIFLTFPVSLSFRGSTFFLRHKYAASLCNAEYPLQIWYDWKKTVITATDLSCAFSFSWLAIASSFVFFSRSRAFSKSRSLSWKKVTNLEQVENVPTGTFVKWIDELEWFLSWTLTQGATRVRLPLLPPTTWRDPHCPETDATTNIPLLLERLRFYRLANCRKISYWPATLSACVQTVPSSVLSRWSAAERRPTTVACRLQEKRHNFVWNWTLTTKTDCAWQTFKLLHLQLKLSGFSKKFKVKFTFVSLADTRIFCTEGTHSCDCRRCVSSFVRSFSAASRSAWVLPRSLSFSQKESSMLQHVDWFYETLTRWFKSCFNLRLSSFDFRFTSSSSSQSDSTCAVSSWTFSSEKRSKTCTSCKQNDTKMAK